MAERLVALRQVCVRAGRSVLLDRLDLVVNAGERVAVLGANGAGKTTLLRLIHGLALPAAGEVVAPPPTQQAMLFQKPILLRRSALDNLCFVLQARGLVADRRDAEARARAALALAGLAAAADRPARALSGGEQQRLALARASLLAPRLLLADEATASLAPAAVHEVEALLAALCAQGTTLIFATHHRGQARRLADRVLFLAEGRLVEDSPAAEFFVSPHSAEANAFLEVDRA